MRLLNSSKYLGGEEDERKVRTDPVSAVFTIIQDFYLNAGRPETIRVAVCCYFFDCKNRLS
jgi:hypothetical protein